MHGGAGNFDIPLPLTGKLGIECRSGGVNRNYQIVVAFATPVTIGSANVTPGTGGTAALSGSPIISGNQVTVNLTNVSNAQKHHSKSDWGKRWLAHGQCFRADGNIGWRHDW